MFLITAWQFFIKRLNDKKDTIVTILIQACRDIIETSQGILILSFYILESTMQGLATLLDDNVDFLLKKLQDDDSLLRGRSNMSLQVKKFNDVNFSQLIIYSKVILARALDLLQVDQNLRILKNGRILRIYQF